jgi:amino acid adenylation domain-containing protein
VNLIVDAPPALAAPDVEGALEPTVPHLVHRQATERSTALAVEDSEMALTYGDLDRWATDIGSLLRARGVREESIVAIFLPRSARLVAAALGVLQTGASYLPLDPDYPADRITFMLEDAGVRAVLTSQDLAGRVPSGPWQPLVLTTSSAAQAPARDAVEGPLPSPQPPGRPDSAAYVIYTSGSTGRPKGVQVSHGSLQNLCRWHREAFQVKADDRATLIASPSFDAAVWEIWPYVTAGASLHVPAETARTSPTGLRDWLVERAVTVTFLPTPLAEAVMALEWPSRTGLRLLLTGGDVLHRQPPAGLPFVLVNNYGPTEGTVVTTSGVVSAGGAAGLPTIGRPIADVTVRVLDSELQPVPAGEPGELCVAGAGLARGYLNRPRLTAEKFLVDGRGERFYRTGDLVRERPDGELEFLGRLDDQVKIRGFRIELHEIVAVLNRHPAVEASAVVAREDGEGARRLVAYAVPAGGLSLDTEELRAHLAQQLPEYMLPAAFVTLAELPLTPNGKVDKDALPAPEQAGTRDAAGTGPRTPLEDALRGIVCELLDLQQVGMEDNFFVLGGHSLLGAQLIVRIRDRFGVELSLRSLFDSPTVESMAVAVEERLVAEIDSLTEEEAERRLAVLAGGQV